MTTVDTTTPAAAAQPPPAALPPPMQLREIVFGAARAASVRAAVRLRIADALGEQPASIGELASAVDVEPDPLRRLLRSLACCQIFAETEDGHFRHTEMSRLLREDTPGSLRNIALWCTEPWTWEAWPLLDRAVRGGGCVVNEIYGKDFFAYLHEDAPESARVFDAAMTTSSRQSAADVAAFLDLDGVKDVVDIGGGQGHVLASLLERHPALRGSLLDLPQVVANADPRLRDGGPLASRATLVPGDCRREVPVEADLYIIKNILEWNDESTRRTLANVVAAARPGARVVVIENLVDNSPSSFTTAMDLFLLLNVGGRKHTEDSMVTRMTEAGLNVTDIRPVNGALHAFDSTVPATGRR
ncbi:methyltransferase [Streptomyces antimycoticus]|uniref:Methyltransferase n=3 Tax=Streptomyces violaceusniger group TaxID=2839105 RepID=A0ABD5JK20_9ACTN|nr:MULTISPECIES: methyltransferase [Streptomyces]MEE4588788.1 methyltransferase [Streptomyces sp. DSM 41602]AJZ83243.1 methyltransferase [Streptomyces sp. AgN23]KUL67160.1 methyltransferase [Streptomyces violaceusniger]RSS42060.1 methyltransferase [Streptomyces sp. WAC05858]WJD96449.1 methyltransferase [Streptomyces antimycoticus]